MNSLFAHGIKQIQTIKTDLSALENTTNAPLSSQGLILVLLSGLSRTIGELLELIEKEQNNETRGKLEKRLAKFKNEHQELKDRFQKAKQVKEDAQVEANRGELFNRGVRSTVPSLSTSSTDNPYFMSYDEGMSKERDSLGRSSRQLDEILQMGQQSFDDLLVQNEYLQKFEKKLALSLMTLGVLRGTITRVERRAYQDRFLFFGGAIVTLVCFFLIYKYLG